MANADVQNLVITLHGRGWSQRRVAGELGISRNTVSVILERVDTAREQGHDVLPPAPVKRGSTLDGHEDFVRGRLKKYPELSAVRVHEDLQERGFAGGYTIVKELVRRLRPQPKKGPLRPMERIPGKQGQQDWSPYTLDFTEAGRQTVQCFSLVLAYSRRQYIDFTERADMYTFTRQHVLAFERFGGVPHEILYDRQKVVVLGREGGRNIYNPRFLAFATHYGFRPRALPARKPEWKPIVEKAFQHVEGNCLAGRDFRDLGHLREHGLWWLDNRSDPRKHATTGELPIERFERERDDLLPLPAHPYDTAEVGYRVVDGYGFAQWDTNAYSVPYGHVLDIVVVRATEGEVFVYGRNLDIIARHERRPRGARQRVEQPGHHPKKKQRDIDALEARLAALDEVGALFVAGLARRQRYRGKHLAMTLALQERYDLNDLIAALRRAVRYEAFDAATVTRILEQTATPRVLPDSGRMEAARLRLRSVQAPTTPRDLGVYAKAFRGADDEE